ncbi:methyltransferase domain-containing protein [Micromonospora sp. WMMD1102]|uniref:protein-L-isoaspartate O-methyltransferase family protein n=1 Tax=Micromonospora sp. WMMD1102 TaxID=3016105 RepID=UPI002414EF44|nr:methyltransferase domain-containing protein [Micromonospora sp. WMMD1102]MDG4788379.1 methyltransferase domain-containing protein [Micromonospora sp. WMMD1102]
MTAADELRARYVDQLRQEGLLGADELVQAFRTVPREEFVATGFDGGDGRWLGPDDPDFLPLVYRNHPLVTKLVDGIPASSSSQPSLMAAMIESLELRPGSRVLEIGVGTGYNAALMTAMGARVTTVDIAPDVVERAEAALRRVGLAGAVDVRLGDGYLGAPAETGYDRVVVTVGVTGVSPRWLDQLVPGGYLLAPVEHAGNHPVLRIRPGVRGVAEAR